RADSSPRTRDTIPDFEVSGSDINEVALVLVRLQQTVGSSNVSQEQMPNTTLSKAMQIDPSTVTDLELETAKDTLIPEAIQSSKQRRKIVNLPRGSRADVLTLTVPRHPKGKQPNKAPAGKVDHRNKGLSKHDSRREKENVEEYISSGSSDDSDEGGEGEGGSKNDDETDEEVIPMQFQIPTAEGSTKTVSFMSNTTFDHFLDGAGSFLKCPKDKVTVSFRFNNSCKAPMCLDTEDDWKRLQDDYRSAAENAEGAYLKARRKWKAEGKTKSRLKKKTIEVVIISRGSPAKDKLKGSGMKGKKGSQKGEVHRDSDGSDKSDSEIEPSGDANSTRGRWIMKIRSQKEWKCEQHPGTVCFQRSDGYHYQLTTQDLNYWAGLIDKGLGQVNATPEELPIHEKSNEKPINKRTTKASESTSGLATIEAPTNALAQAVQLVTMTFGAGRGLAPPTAAGEPLRKARSFTSITNSVDPESISSPALRCHVWEQVVYPAVEPWLARLKATDPDNHPWTEYGAALLEKKYLRINQLADTQLMSTEKLMCIVPGLEEGSADYLISTAIDECAELQANARKALMRERE
ncbi:hypothetical protein FRC04_007136, partial [Tulasnella sp. 424]